MRAVVITGERQASVEEVAAPEAGPGQVVVDIARAGLCGTDIEFFTGEMTYLLEGHAAYPLRIGHEWSGVVVAVGEGVDRSWVGRRTTGDTMLSCFDCDRCRAGRGHLCERRFEVGIRGGWPGALASSLVVPVTSLHALPDTVDDVAGALVEPGGNALRAVRAAGLSPGDRLMILGAGTIGLLAGSFAAADGVEVHILGRSPRSVAFASTLGFARVWVEEELVGSAGPDTQPLPHFDAVIDASNDPTLPARAVELAVPGGRVVYIGLSGTPSLVDTRSLALKDLTAVGILSGSPGLDGAIERYATGAVDPRPLVAATVGLSDVPAVLAGQRPVGAGPGPKILVDPSR